MAKQLTLLFLLFSVITLSAQDPFKSGIIEQRLELLAERQANTAIDFTTILDQLAYYYQFPLNLNQAYRENLESLGLLTGNQITAFLNYRTLYGNFTSIYELRLIDGFDAETIQSLIPFISTENSEQRKFSLSNALKYGRSDLFVRYQRVLEKSRGYKIADTTNSEDPANNAFLGSRDFWYTRYRFTYQTQLSAGVTIQKDAGEPFGNPHMPEGFDFYSAHAFYKGDGFLKSLAIGDMRTEFGQGLTFSTGFGLRKTADVNRVMRFPRGLVPYTSVDENQFLRGVGATVGTDHINFTAFFSKKRIDANFNYVSDTSETEEQIFTSFQNTGLHRTLNELEDKNALEETIYGASLGFKNDWFRANITSVKTELGGNLQRSLTYYNQYTWNNNENLNTGFDFIAQFNKLSIFSEMAHSMNGGMAGIGGLTFSPDSRVTMSLVHRNYGVEYQPVYSNALGEKSVNNNEVGTYFGIKANITTFMNVQAYVDRFEYKWLSYRIDGPGKGEDYLIQLNFTPLKRTQFYARLRHEEKSLNSGEENTINKIATQHRSSLRFHVDHTINSQWRMKTRVEWSRYHLDADTSNGFMIYQDLRYSVPSDKLVLTGRLALFQTDSYDSRIYAYENDLLYVFSVPAYYYTGFRWYMLARYKVNRNLSFWARVSRSTFTDRDSVGSGLDEIEGSHRTDVKLQMRLRF